ncbi:MAG: hypothetical protein ACLQF4_13455 [Xanthobacteraceae bacterium]
MLTQEERAEAERQAASKCTSFEEVMSEIVYGFDGSNVHHIMTRDIIIEYIRARFGPLYVQFLSELPQFTLH